MTTVLTFGRHASEVRVEDRREAILRAAIECIGQAGLDGVSIKTIAERANVSTALVFYHFESKENLALQALQAALQEGSDRVDASLGSERGLDRIETKFRVFWQEESPASESSPFRLEYWAQASRNEALRDQHFASFEATHRDYVESLETDLATGKLRPDIDPSLIADAITALGYGFRVQMSLDQVTPERALQAVHEVLRLLRPME